uniref:Uncharacterized protein n=1 Tax=Anguilla anguilla TaxID=7936 RepID=A0A0E9UL08_ANGAN
MTRKLRTAAERLPSPSRTNGGNPRLLS